ncbi:MAG TPA: TetR/AcrR family transcriptional regulator [Kofleriaceae bacterium]|nr:TetR/AcrR family transcriptional regulator [Kofleriaceae bacterium]
MAELRRSSQVRQVELTDAALHIIATKGIAALTTRSLADEVGLTTGAIFRHFATLQDLLEAVVARVEAVLDASYPPATLPPLERLDRFIEARTRAVGGQLGILRLVVSEQFLLALPARGSERLAACVKKSRAFVLACLHDAQRAGVVRDDLAADVLAPIVMGTMQMLAVSRSSAQQRVAESQRVRDGLFTLLRPVAAAPARRPARKRSSS